jgi:hypothetical protein
VGELFLWLLDALESAWVFTARLASAVWKVAKERVKRRPGEAIALAIAFLRLFSTTVRSGHAGVLFHFGRARRVLEPGFHWLIPVVQRVRKLPARAVTSNLALQRIETAGGLVYEADANVVWQAVDPLRTLVEIADARRGPISDHLEPTGGRKRIDFRHPGAPAKARCFRGGAHGTWTQRRR